MSNIDTLKKELVCTDAERKAVAGLLIQIQFFGCFRVKELFRICWHHVDFERGVELVDHKGRRATGPNNEVIFKPLIEWRGGRTCLQLMKNLMSKFPSSSTIVPEHILTKAQYTAIIAKTVAKVKMDTPILRFRSHSLRHGGINNIRRTKFHEETMATWKKNLLMSESTILRYCASNEERQQQASSIAQRIRNESGEILQCLVDALSLSRTDDTLDSWMRDHWDMEAIDDEEDEEEDDED